MSTDRVLAVFSLLGLIAFVAPVVLMVAEPALIAVLLIGIGMASFDFWRELWGGRRL